jgi:hypothetical protein
LRLYAFPLGISVPDKLPEGRPLRDLMDRFVFCVEGWDDSREIHMVPEIRRFYSAFHSTWPYWLYFCNLDVDTLRAMAMCCLPEVNTLQALCATERKCLKTEYSPGPPSKGGRKMSAAARAKIAAAARLRWKKAKAAGRNTL